MMRLFKGFEPKEGDPVLFLGVHALRWPYDSGVQPTIAFTDDVDPVYEAAPQLLEALENLENDDGAIPDHAWRKVQAAIAAAKGVER